MIDICLLEKTGEDKDISYPLKLIHFANEQKNNPDIAFDKERDKMIIVFDADIFEKKVEKYEELVNEGSKENILGITNPAFELFLLLHFKNSYETDIAPYYEEIINNEKIGKQRFIYKLLHDRSGMNSKTNSSIGDLAENIDIAIEQEKNLNQNIYDCKGKITCNIGKIIDDIRKDQTE